MGTIKCECGNILFQSDIQPSVTIKECDKCKDNKSIFIRYGVNRKSIVLLEYLLSGFQYELPNGETLAASEDGRIGFKRKVETWDKGKLIKSEEGVMIFDMPLNWFMDQAEAIPDEDVFLLNANKVLTELNSGKRRT
jgi:hypothetical protein